jgi:hypothetical protein
MICFRCDYFVLICAIVCRNLLRLWLLNSISGYLIFELFKITLFSDKHVTLLPLIPTSIHRRYRLLHLIYLTSQVFLLKAPTTSLRLHNLLKFLNGHDLLLLLLLHEPDFVLHPLDLICELLPRDTVQLRGVLLLIMIVIVFFFVVVFLARVKV